MDNNADEIFELIKNKSTRDNNIISKFSRLLHYDKKRNSSIVQFFEILLPDIARQVNQPTEMECFFMEVVKIYKEFVDREYKTLPKQKDIAKNDDNYVLLWLINE